MGSGIRPHSSHRCRSRRGESGSRRSARYRLAGLAGRRPDSAPMARILVTEKIADGGLERLRAAGHEVDVQLDLTPEQLARGGARAPTR